MEPQQKIDLLWDRFVHRADTYALQWFNPERGGGYARQKKGSCQHAPKCSERGRECVDVRYIPLKKDDLIRHLVGTETIATYAVDKNNTVKWLCLDIDIRKGEEGDAQALTLATARFVASILPRECFRVEFSGNRGYHLWIFFAEPVDIQKAYTLGMWIRAHAPTDHSVGIEIYPKQQEITLVGNPVKIPLGIHRKSGNRCMFVRGDFTEHENQWDVLASVQPLTAAELDSVLKKNDIRIVPRDPPSPLSGTSRALPCMTRAMNEGFDEGVRDIGFFRIALYLKDKGIPFDLTLQLLEAMNAKCDPPFEAVYEKAASAYSRDYSTLPCNEPAFDHYCSSTCYFYKKKVEQRGFGKDYIIKQLSRD